MKNNGFSLIELVIVLGIVALLASFSYPSYRESIIKARRIDGQTALIELATNMETFYFKNNSYSGATIGTGTETDIAASSYSAENWYRLKITNQSDNNYSLEATPIRAQAMDDKDCQTLRFNNLGVKDVRAGPAGPPRADKKQCW
jgi:type IV pilus assembly protein PilE